MFSLRAASWDALSLPQSYIISSTEAFQKALTALVDSCAEIKRASSVAQRQFWQSLEEGAGKRCSECGGDKECPFSGIIIIMIIIM